jgi:hypothetical protein
MAEADLDRETEFAPAVTSVALLCRKSLNYFATLRLCDGRRLSSVLLNRGGP